MKPFHKYITEAKSNPYRYVGANPTVDLVVFREGESGLEVLLIKRASGSVEGGKWAIPGGFVNTTAKAGERWKDGQTESIADAAIRELEEETGLKITPELRRGLRSVGIYQGGGRDPRDNKTSWSISYAYTVTIPRGTGNRVRGMDDASDARWYPVKRLPRLAFDHKDILTDALGWSKETEERRKSTAALTAQRKKEAGRFASEVLRMDSFILDDITDNSGEYLDFGHMESPAGYQKKELEDISKIRRDVWGVGGSQIPELWVATSEIKPSRGMTRVTIRKPKNPMRDTHEDVFPEMLGVDKNSYPMIQGRIDHERRVITAIPSGEGRGARFSSSALDRIFGELKRKYPGYSIWDRINESQRILPFSVFITEAGRGLISRKNQWGDTTSGEVRKNNNVQQDIFDIINAAYKSIGGHPDFPDVQSVPADNNVVQVIDTDTEDDVDAVVLSKTTPFGKKLTTLGSDGGADAKRELLKKAVDILKTPGNYVEASGKLLDILLTRGAPVVKDENLVRAVLRGKEIQWQGEDGSYFRKIGGKTHTKKMLGNPKA